MGAEGVVREGVAAEIATEHHSRLLPNQGLSKHRHC